MRYSSCLLLIGAVHAFVAIPNFPNRDDADVLTKPVLLDSSYIKTPASVGRRLDPTAYTTPVTSLPEADNMTETSGETTELRLPNGSSIIPAIDEPKNVTTQALPKKSRARQFIDAVTSGTGRTLSIAASVALVLASFAAFLTTPVGSAAASVACGTVYARRFPVLRGTFVENWLMKCTGIGAVNTAFGPGTAAAATVAMNVVESQLDKLFYKMTGDQFHAAMDMAIANKLTLANTTPVEIFQPIATVTAPESWTSWTRTALGGLPDPRVTYEIVELAEPL